MIRALVAKIADYAFGSNPPCTVTGTTLSQMRLFDAEVRKRTTVLLLDDNKSARDFLSIQLHKLGVKPIAASDGLNAFELAKNERPSVICHRLLHAERRRRNIF